MAKASHQTRRQRPPILDGSPVVPMLARAARAIRRLLPTEARLAVVMGSGFGSAIRAAESERAVGYDRIPGFLPTRVPGHAGQLVAARIAGVPVLLLAGRAHYYEGHSLAALTFPIRVLAELRVAAVLLTNAAGAIHPSLRVGDFMLIDDHLNLLGDNPLRGPVMPGRDRFVDLSHVYDETLKQRLLEAAEAVGVRLQRGVYAAVSGPSYETPAEIRALARLGADAVGMSTVPEAIVARQCGLRVAGLSCITNLAAGRTPQSLRHADVIAEGSEAGPGAARILREFLRRAHSGLASEGP